MAMEPMDGQEVPEFDYRQLDFGALAPLVDLIYSAVIGYPIILFGELLGPLFVQGGESIQWVNVALVSFVLLYSLAGVLSSIHRCRQSIAEFPHSVCGCFLVGRRLGDVPPARQQAVMSVVVSRGRGSQSSGCRVVWLSCWWSLRTHGVTELGWTDTQWLLANYLVWLAHSTAMKELYGVPRIDTDMFPTSLVDVGVRKAIKCFRKDQQNRW